TCPPISTFIFGFAKSTVATESSATYEPGCRRALPVSKVTPSSTAGAPGDGAGGVSGLGVCAGGVCAGGACAGGGEGGAALDVSAGAARDCCRGCCPAVHPLELTVAPIGV